MSKLTEKNKLIAVGISVLAIVGMVFYAYKSETAETPVETAETPVEIVEEPVETKPVNTHLTKEDEKERIQELWDDKSITPKERQLAIQQVTELRAKQEELAKIGEELKAKQKQLDNLTIKEKIAKGNAQSSAPVANYSKIDKLHKVGSTQLYRNGTQPYGMESKEVRSIAANYNLDGNNVIVYHTDDDASTRNTDKEFMRTTMKEMSAKKHSFTDLQTQKETNNGQVVVQYTDGLALAVVNDQVNAGVLGVRLETPSNIDLFKFSITDQNGSQKFPIQVISKEADVYVNISEQMSDILASNPQNEFIYLVVDRKYPKQDNGLIEYEFFKSNPIMTYRLNNNDLTKMKE